MVSMVFSSVPNVMASVEPQLSVNLYTEKEIYSYGDYLSFTIEVSEIKDDFAILHIIDELGKGSSAIPIPITELQTTVPSPYPFESTVYPLGKYTLKVEYSGLETTTEFELIDSGQLVIPTWIKDFSAYWINGQISDTEFAMGIQFLIKEQIIIVQEKQIQEEGSETKIPQWIKTNTQWWLERKISDADFASGIEYLIKIGIIVV